MDKKAVRVESPHSFPSIGTRSLFDGEASLRNPTVHRRVAASASSERRVQEDGQEDDHR